VRGEGKRITDKNVRSIELRIGHVRKEAHLAHIQHGSMPSVLRIEKIKFCFVELTVCY